MAVLAWSPLPHEWREVATETHADLSRFLGRLAETQRCAVFFDEAGGAVSQRQLPETGWTATLTRHSAHSVHFLSQRAAGMVAPLVRDQCERLYAFRVSATDARALASEYGRPELVGASELIVEPGVSSEYFVADWRGCTKQILPLKR